MTLSTLLIIALLAFVLAALGSQVSERAQIRRRLQRLDVKMDTLLSHHGLIAPEDEPRISAAVASLLDKGRTVEAIGQHRRETGLGLGEAKRAIEDAHAWLAEQQPDKRESGA